MGPNPLMGIASGLCEPNRVIANVDIHCGPAIGAAVGGGALVKAAGVFADVLSGEAEANDGCLDDVELSSNNGIHSQSNNLYCPNYFPLPGFIYPYIPQFNYGIGITSNIRPRINMNAKCQKGMHEAGADMNGLNRALANWDTISHAANTHAIAPAMLASIGLRESDFTDKNQVGGGQGVGVYQFTVSASSGVTGAQANNLVTASDIAANMLESNMNYLANKFPNFTSMELLQATAASYNFGATKNISGNPNTIDAGTTHGNYGISILLLMNCFI